MPESPNSTAPFPISRVRRVVDIDAVDDVAGYIKVHGREIAVHHLDAAAYRAIGLVQADPAGADVTLLYDAVERVCPELSRDEIDRLSGPKIGAVLAVAELGIKDVEAAIPNADRATEVNDPPSPSSPPISSDTSSPASPSPRTETSNA